MLVREDKSFDDDFEDFFYEKKQVATAPAIVPTVVEPLVFEDLYDIKMNIEKFLEFVFMSLEKESNGDIFYNEKENRVYVKSDSLKSLMSKLLNKQFDDSAFLKALNFLNSSLAIKYGSKIFFAAPGHISCLINEKRFKNKMTVVQIATGLGKKLKDIGVLAGLSMGEVVSDSENYE